MISVRSVRAVAAFAGATSRRSAPKSRESAAKTSFYRFLSSVASKSPVNPFEIQLNLTDPVSTTETLSLADAKRAAKLQLTEAERDIALLHDEMSNLFGEEVAEHDGSGASSNVAEMQSQILETPMVVKREQVAAVEVAPAKDKSVQQKSSRSKANKQELQQTPEVKKPLNVFVAMGPCSVMREVWTSGNVPMKELGRQIQEQAEGLEITVKNRWYQAESDILDLLLKGYEDQVFVLCWEISLSKSPFVVRALELTQSRVIVVSPKDVDHGPLPSNVVGVLSGFGRDSISMALTAATKLVLTTAAPNAEEVAKAKRVRVKQQDRRCYSCGERGHMQHNCPERAKAQSADA